MTPDFPRLFRECDRQERILDDERDDNHARINAILDRSVWAEQEPEGGSAAFIIAAVFAATVATAVCLAPSELWQMMGY